MLWLLIGIVSVCGAAASGIAAIETHGFLSTLVSLLICGTSIVMSGISAEEFDKCEQRQRTHERELAAAKHAHELQLLTAQQRLLETPLG